MSERAGRYQRTFSGLVGAMVVLVLVVLAFVALRAINRNDVEDPVKAIDYTESLELWQSEAQFPLLTPPELPAGWIATSVSFDKDKPQAFHLGVLTDERRYIGIEQKRADVASMVSEFVDEGAEEGTTVQAAGALWTVYTDAGGDTALVSRTDGVTTLVVGTVPQALLVQYVDSLR